MSEFIEAKNEKLKTVQKAIERSQCNVDELKLMTQQNRDGMIPSIMNRVLDIDDCNVEAGCYLNQFLEVYQNAGADPKQSTLTEQEWAHLLASFRYVDDNDPHREEFGQYDHFHDEACNPLTLDEVNNLCIKLNESSIIIDPDPELEEVQKLITQKNLDWEFVKWACNEAFQKMDNLDDEGIPKKTFITRFAIGTHDKIKQLEDWMKDRNPRLLPDPMPELHEVSFSTKEEVWAYIDGLQMAGSCFKTLSPLTNQDWVDLNCPDDPPEANPIRHLFTFGQVHRHEVGNKVFDKDCVAVIWSRRHSDARIMAMKVFGTEWCMSYEEKDFPEDHMKSYARGQIELNERTLS